MKNLWDNILNNPKPFLIAEIGVNFYDIAAKEGTTPMEAAKKMILEAKRSGCDAAKFQSYKAKTLASKNSPSYWDTNKEPSTSQFHLFSKFDSFSREHYEELAEHCNEVGILFLSTPFDFESADYLESMIPFYKISSSDLSNLPFIEHMAKKGKPILLSTGASTLDEVRKAVVCIEKTGNREICVMHCMLSYPTDFSDANINVIDALREAFPRFVLGYSDHTPPDEAMLVLTTAFAKGAKILEKHFTLDKTLQGNDHYHAADPEDVKKFKKNAEFLVQIGGLAERRVFPCEENSRKYARRSLVLNEDARSGTVVTKGLLSFKRPGTGISPADLEQVLGKALIKDMNEDDILTWDCLGA